MQQSKTLDQKISELKAENEQKLERKIKELGIKEQLLKATGLDFMVLIHSENSTSIWIDNDQYNKCSKFDRMKIKEYYDQICTLFTPTNAPVKVSGGQYENFAPAKLDFENHFSEITYNHQQTVKIVFTFEGGINVTFKAPSAPEYKTFADGLISYKWAELKPHNKDTMGKRCYYLTQFERINMYGNNFYVYCKQPEHLEQFMNVVFYGTTDID